MRAPRSFSLLILALATGLSSWWGCEALENGMMPPATPTPTAAVKVSGDGQTATVGQQLADPLVVQINDQFGNAMSAITVNFSVTGGDGSVSPASGMTDASGQVSTDWVLGTGAGAQEVTATVANSSVSTAFAATGEADAPTGLAEVSGNNQRAPRSATLPDPVTVRVVDQFGNGVSGIDVAFEVTSGGGSIDPAMATTDAAGEANTVWTLGSTIGQQTIDAVLTAPDDTIQFTAEALDFFITSIAPDTIAEGLSATITGEGFDDATPANNMVTIDGVPAVVTAATQTELTVTVPAFDCKPARDVDVLVTLAGQTTNTVSHPLEPAAFLNLAVGEQQIIQDPNSFCLQFAPSALGGDEYIIGVGSAAETPNAVLSFSLTAEMGATLPVAPPVPLPVRRVATSSRPLPDPETLERWNARLKAEAALREWEERHLLGSGRAIRQSVTPAAAVVPSVGDTITFRVPDADGPDFCQFAEITTVVRVVGQAGVFVTDTANPTTDSLTLAELQAYSDTFDVNLYDVDTTYLGTPSDLDTNQRVFVVLTVEVNKFSAVAGFAFSGDLFDRAFCAASDSGEIFYGHVPDPNNEAGPGARSKANVLAQMASLIAHEFAHVIQQSRRVVINPGAGMSRWEAEGQATLMEEVVGHDVLGNTPGQNYGSAVARGAPGGTQWYDAAFRQLARYFGHLPSGGKAANAPEDCTLFGADGVVTGCEFFQFYGASYAFQRFVADQFGPSYPGGEAALHRDWVSANPTLNGVANIEALLGVSFDSVFSRWAAMLYADDRTAGLDPSIAMLSWDMLDIFSSFASDDFRLIPVDRSFVAFSDTRGVRGGSTAYTRLSAAAARPALALRARDAADDILSMGPRPQFWVVRLQ